MVTELQGHHSQSLGKWEKMQGEKNAPTGTGVKRKTNRQTKCKTCCKRREDVVMLAEWRRTEITCSKGSRSFGAGGGGHYKKLPKPHLNLLFSIFQTPFPIVNNPTNIWLLVLWESFQLAFSPASISPAISAGIWLLLMLCHSKQHIFFTIIQLLTQHTQ